MVIRQNDRVRVHWTAEMRAALQNSVLQYCSAILCSIRPVPYCSSPIIPRSEWPKKFDPPGPVRPVHSQYVELVPVLVRILLNIRHNYLRTANRPHLDRIEYMRLMHITTIQQWDRRPVRASVRFSVRIKWTEAVQTPSTDPEHQPTIRMD